MDLAAGIIGKLLRQSREVFSGIEPLPDLLHLLIRLLGGAIRVDLQEDMTGSDLLVPGKGVGVVFVIGADVTIGQLDRRAQSVGIHEQVVDNSAFGHLEVLLVLREELGNLLVTQDDLFTEPIRRQADIANAGGFRPLLVVVDDLLVRNKHVLGKHGADLLGEQIRASPFLELLDGEAVGLQNLAVTILPYKAAIGELECRNLGDVSNQLVIGHPQPHTVCLVENDFLGHQLIHYLHR